MPGRSTTKSKLTDASASKGNSKKGPQKSNAKSKEIASSISKKNSTPKRAKSDLGASKENAKESTKAAVNDKKKTRITEIKPRNEAQKLNASWKFLAVIQFLWAFRFSLNFPSFTLDDLETGVRERDPIATDIVLDIIVILLQKLYNASTTKETIHKDLHDYLLQIDYPIQEPKRGPWRFWQLDILGRIHALNALINQCQEHIPGWFIDVPIKTLRNEPIGTDSEGWTYYCFGETRLYREIPISVCTKKGEQELQKTEYTFELVCRTLYDWRACVSKLKLNKPSEEALLLKLRQLASDVVLRMEREEEERIKREEAERKKEEREKRARELEEMPRKRSGRLQAKSEEVAKRRKIDEERQVKIALEQIKRQEEKEEKEKEQQAMVDKARWLKARIFELIGERIESIEQPQTLPREERKRRANEPSPEIARLADLRGILRKNATEYERIVKMHGWVTLLSEDEAVWARRGDKNASTLQESICFEGSGVERDLDSPFMQNTLRILLITLDEYAKGEESTVGEVDLLPLKTKLLLDRYHSTNRRSSGFQLFMEDLDAVIAASDAPSVLHSYVHNLILQIFGQDGGNDASESDDTVMHGGTKDTNVHE